MVGHILIRRGGLLLSFSSLLLCAFRCSLCLVDATQQIFSRSHVVVFVLGLLRSDLPFKSLELDAETLRLLINVSLFVLQPCSKLRQ